MLDGVAGKLSIGTLLFISRILFDAEFIDHVPSLDCLQFSWRHFEYAVDQVDIVSSGVFVSANIFGDRMLHLQSRVHFEEVEDLMRVHNKLNPYWHSCIQTRQ